MSDAWKKSPEFLGWLKEPSAERYVRDLKEQTDQALQQVLGAASCSEDAIVAKRYATWKTLLDNLQFLVNSRKESVLDSDE